MDQRVEALIQANANPSGVATIKSIFFAYKRRYGTWNKGAHGTLVQYFRLSPRFEFIPVGAGRHQVRIIQSYVAPQQQDDGRLDRESTMATLMTLREQQEAIKNWGQLRDFVSGVVDEMRAAATPAGEGVPAGAVTLKYPSGAVMYVGQMDGGKRHGQGKCFHENGKVQYEGEFVNDQFHGRGIYYYPSGERYDGEFSQNVKNGHGVYHYASGEFERYDGQWENGQKQGDALLFYSREAPYGYGSYLETIWRANRILKIGKCWFK